MEKVRSFIALPASDEVRSRIAAVLKDLEQTQAEVKWDGPEKFHITLKFLGDVEPETLETLARKLGEQIATIPAFDILYESVEAFPSSNRPNIVWVGTRQSQTILQVQNIVEEICEQFGFARERRAFHPHITLGRVKGNKNLHRLTEGLKNITFEPIPSRCSNVLLIKSDLKPTGSVYTTLKSIPFKL